MPTAGKTVGAYEAKTLLSKLLDKFDADEEITITKHGAAAKLVPVKKQVSAEQHVAANAWIQQLPTPLSFAGLKVKDLINEGRR